MYNFSKKFKRESDELVRNNGVLMVFFFFSWICGCRFVDVIQYSQLVKKHVCVGFHFNTATVKICRYVALTDRRMMREVYSGDQRVKKLLE